MRTHRSIEGRAGEDGVDRQGLLPGIIVGVVSGDLDLADLLARQHGGDSQVVDDADAGGDIVGSIHTNLRMPTAAVIELLLQCYQNACEVVGRLIAANFVGLGVECFGWFGVAPAIGGYELPAS